MANRRPLQVSTGQATPDRVSRDVEATLDANSRPGGPQLGAGGVAVRGALRRDNSWEGISFLSGQTRVVRHGLGRRPQGWIVTRSYGEGVDLLREIASDKDTITLEHSAGSGHACKVELWLF